MRFLHFVRVTALVLCCTTAWAGPFGFEAGMTWDQIQKLVGPKAVKEIKGDVYTLTTAPNPHPAFESYVLNISPDKGLLKIQALSVDIPTTVYGVELKSEFSEIHDAIVKVYGAGTDYDFLPSGSLWTEPEDWMMGLLKMDRSLNSYWIFKTPKGGITAISLEAKALNTEKGYLLLGYEFQGWSEYVDSVKGKQNSVF